MKKYYISSKAGLSGICKYSHDFYELVLKDKGYIFIDSNDNLTTIFTRISSIDIVHIEIGIFQRKEIEILFAMLNANYKNVIITMHDAPLLKYPLHEFENAFFNKISKFYDKYIDKFSNSRLYLSKIKTIYVLSEKGLRAVKSKYKIDNVYFLPHIIDTTEVIIDGAINNNFIYFGFIGRNKGIEYSLKLHKQLLTNYPESNFFVIGRAMGKENHFYDFLKETYNTNVHYLGYVPEEELNEVFEMATFSLMTFKNYKFYHPFSGSLLYNLKKGKIVFATNSNSVGEVIHDGKNGFLLSGEIKKDVEIVSGIISNKHLLNDIKNEVHNYLMLNHTNTIVSNNLLD